MMYFLSFVFGGFLCAIAQILIDFTKLTPARILVLYVVLGAIFTYLGFYNKLKEIFGAGATVPIMGFGNSLANGVIKAIGKDGLFGIISGGLTATAAGISAAVIAGVFFALIFKSKTK